MIVVLYHDTKQVVETQGADGLGRMRIANALLACAEQHPDAVIAWCDIRLKPHFALENVDGLMHHKRLLYSFSTSGTHYLGREIGFCEDASPFIPVNPNVKYPTWQASAQIGLVHASAVNAFRACLRPHSNFSYFLHSFAKRAMRAGLLCYSDPKLLKPGFPVIDSERASAFELFQFVRQHYRLRWIALLLANFILFKRRFPLLPAVCAFFARKALAVADPFASLPIASTREMPARPTVDVIIPTIGRKEHFRNVIEDLAAQTYLPAKVVVVEQNPVEGSVSELGFLQDESWPFAIDHVFTHRAGACAARNTALARTRSEIVFMADDDIRFSDNLIEAALAYFRRTGNEIVQAAGPQPGEQIKETEIVQLPVLGSGLVFVKQECLKNVSFGAGFEFGYGEDKDFGMQLRNNGYDILLVPFIKVLHLKAPMGGFRIKPAFAWSADPVAPKPSPTIMLYMTRNMLAEQVQGYKVLYFLRTLGRTLNFAKAYRKFNKHWERSVYWATELSKK